MQNLFTPVAERSWGTIKEMVNPVLMRTYEALVENMEGRLQLRRLLLHPDTASRRTLLDTKVALRTYRSDYNSNLTLKANTTSGGRSRKRKEVVVTEETEVMLRSLAHVEEEEEEDEGTSEEESPPKRNHSRFHYSWQDEILPMPKRQSRTSPAVTW